MATGCTVTHGWIFYHIFSRQASLFVVFIVFYCMMLGAKAPNYDAYGLFRASHSHNPPPIFAYRGIIIPLLCSYRGGSQGLSSTYEQAHVDLDLLTLASLYIFCYHIPDGCSLKSKLPLSHSTKIVLLYKLHLFFD